MPTAPWQSHQRLESTPDASSARPSRCDPNSHIVRARVSDDGAPKPKRPWWRRILRSCMTSSNPDPDLEAYRPPPPRPATDPAQLEEMDFSRKQKRASYVPQHAASTFATSTTPLGGRDALRAKRSTLIYHAGSHAVPEEALSESSGSVTSPKSPPVGLSFDPPPAGSSEAPATSHF